MKPLLIALTLFAVSSTTLFADDYYIKRRPSGRYDVRDSYGNSVGSIRRNGSGRLRMQTYDNYYRQPEMNYFYTTPYRSANPGMYYQFNADGSYQWYYSY